jgi:hypothetical protein
VHYKLSYCAYVEKKHVFDSYTIAVRNICRSPLSKFGGCAGIVSCRDLYFSCYFDVNLLIRSSYSQ